MNGRIETRAGTSARSATRRGLTRALLAWAAGVHPAGEAGQCLDVEGEIDDRQLRHIVDAGLAPLLHHAAHDRLEIIPARWHDVLKGAELTARFVHGALCDSATQVIDVCRDVGAPVTLLKGISVSDQYYPAPHLRPMGDVDLLLSERDCPVVESVLLRKGYTRMANFHVGEGEPHGAPLLDPQRSVWIEPHTALFHMNAHVNANSLFAPVNVARRSIASTFHGRPVLRLSDELQLAYIASYWLRDISRNRMHPSFLVPLLDALFLLNASAESLDWDGLLDSLDNEMAIASLYVLLVQVKQYGFDDHISPVLPRLAAMQRIVGAAELRIMGSLLDACLVDGKQFMGSFGGRHPMIESTIVDTLLTSNLFARKVLALPWNFVFPPRVPERYSAGYQAGRIARLLRGKR